MLTNNLINKIIGTVSYIDTVQIWFPRRLKRYELDTIESLCMGKRMYPICEKMVFHHKWKCRLILQRPKDEVFDFLYEHFGSELLINRVDVALDLLTESLSDAEIVKNYIHYHQVHLWHGKQPMYQYINTTYSAPRNSRRNYVTYASRLSKVIRKHCCHLELRFFAVDVVRNAGFPDILSLKDINYHEFWTKNLQLRELDLEKLGRQFTKRPYRKKPLIKYDRNGKPYNYLIRVSKQILRSCAHSEQGGTVQDVIDRFRGTRVNVPSCMIKIDTDPFLPQ